MFAEFKTKLRNFESTEKFHSNASEDNVMRASASNPERKGRERLGCLDITCYNCGQKASDYKSCEIQRNGLMVDTGATSHIITDLGKFKQFDDEFQPEKHYIELADRTRASGVALRRGDAEVYMIGSTAHQVRTTLRNALYIPSY
ncbi:hypothetical protein QQF64_025521 [Cirrhinus molitorella]|uniref:Uncharacterized protein n=1 Tax=Cirrhinus molitorella TaxID=172907 RepID=A0ABR3NPC3_9TELE